MVGNVLTTRRIFLLWFAINFIPKANYSRMDGRSSSNNNYYNHTDLVEIFINSKLPVGDNQIIFVLFPKPISNVKIKAV